MPGVFDKILEKTNSDPDDHVRSVACSALSATEDPKAIPVFQKIIEDSSTKDELRQGCFEGLVETWTGYPYPKSPNKDGYELTMKVLEGKTRSKEMPPWRGLSKLGYAKTEYKDYDKSGKDWYNTAKAFYDKHGGKAIVLARFVPFVRTFAPIVAGAVEMHYRDFIFYNLLGGLLWAVGATLAGYFFGQIPFIHDNFELAVVAIVLVSVLPIGVHWLSDKLKARAAARAEKATEAAKS